MVPTLLLTGFLGSGKTSLLNRLMQQRPRGGGRMAVVVNELGDVGIDVSLLPPGQTRQVELPGGCICCTLNEDLDRTLTELLDAAPDLETIAIETTGIAEPLPIIWTLEREPLSARIRLAAVITVVDALAHEAHRPLSPSVDTQVEHADLLVVSKVDLLPGVQVPPALRESLRELNKTAPILAGQPADVAHRLWSSLADPELPPRALSPQPRAAPGHQHGFQALAVPIDATLDFEELSAELEALPANYVRIKGIARVVDESTGSAEPRLVAFHRVGARVSVEPLEGPASTRMVALGREMERDRLDACVRKAVLHCPT